MEGTVAQQVLVLNMWQCGTHNLCLNQMSIAKTDLQLGTVGLSNA